MDQIDRYDPDAFDFLGPPFAAPAGGDLLLTVPQEDALSATLNALGRGAGLVVIDGEAGSGRTLVADALAAALRARGLVVDEIAQIGGPGGRALLARLATPLGLAPGRLAPLLDALAATTGDAGPHEAASRDPVGADGWRGLATDRGGAGAGHAGVGHADAGVIDGARPDAGQALGRLAGEAPPRGALAVVVDDAGTWPEADLLLLASMAGLRQAGAPLLQAVLIGDASLQRRFAALGEAAGRDGGAEAVALRIPPLTLGQGEEYLSHRFAAAGGSLQRTMSPGAIDEILLRCGGNPGRIDRLADDCLAITARRRRRYVTSTVVRTARQAPPDRRRLSGPGLLAILGAAGGVLTVGAGVALVVHGQGHPPSAAADRGDPALFAGSGRFAVPAPSAGPVATAPAPRPAPRPYTQEYAAQGFTRMPPVPAQSATPPQPPVAPVPVAPPPAALPPPAPARVALAPVPPTPTPGATAFPPWPAAPRVAQRTAEAAPVPVLPPIALAPVPLAPPLATVDTPRDPAVTSLATAAPDWPEQAGIAARPDAPPRQEALGPAAAPTREAARTPVTDAAPDAPLPPPTPEPTAPSAAQPVRRDGPVVAHVAQRHDTTASLLRRIWGADDQTARALFRSLNPGLDAQGPWPAGTVVTVPQRLRTRTAGAPPLPEPPRVPATPRAPREVVRDNPAGQVQSGVPYFCRSILPQNRAEDAYTRQVCGR